MSNERESMLRPEKKSRVRRRLSSLAVYALALAASLVFAGVALAQQATLTSTVPQSGFDDSSIPLGVPR